MNNHVMIRSGSDAAVALKVSKTGSYEISVDDVTWFESHDTYFTINGVTYSMMAGTLNLVEGPTLSKQWSSRLGPMQQISLTWQASDKMKTRIITAFQLFEENRAIVFTQVSHKVAVSCASTDCSLADLPDHGSSTPMVG